MSLQKRAQEKGRSSSFRSSGSSSPLLGNDTMKKPFNQTMSSSPERMHSFHSSLSPDSRRKDFSKTTITSVPGGMQKTEFTTRTATTKLSNGKSATLATTSTLVTTKRYTAQPPRSVTLGYRTPQSDGTNTSPKKGMTKEAISKWNTGTVTSESTTTANVTRNTNTRSITGTKTVTSASVGGATVRKVPVKDARTQDAKNGSADQTSPRRPVQSKLQVRTSKTGD